jgi:hypothetical protein
MASYQRVHDLLNGFPTAASGTAWFYLPGTSTLIPIFGDDDGTAITNPATLDSNGAATVYLSQLARMIVQDSGGALVADVVINGDADTTITTTSAAFSGATVKAALDSALTAFGGQNFQYVPGGAYVGLTPKAWMNGVVRNVMAYGAVGATSVNDGVTPADSAFAAAVADAQASGGGVVYLGPGTWLFNSQPAINNTGVTIAGAGRGITTIKINSTTLGGPVFTSANGSVVRDLTITTPVSSSGIGVTANNCAGFQLINVKINHFDIGIKTLGNTEDVYIGGKCQITVTDAVAGARAYLCTDTTDVQINGGSFEGASTGYAMEFTGDTGAVYVSGATIGTGTTAIRFAATITGAVFHFVGNSSGSTTVFSFGGSAMPDGFYQSGNGVDGYTGGLLTGATFTPDLAKGNDIMIDATTTGSAYTVAVPAIPPISTARGFYMTLTFYAHAGAPITGWGVAAGYHLSSGPSTVDTHKTSYLLRWDGTVWREVSRSDTT